MSNLIKDVYRFRFVIYSYIQTNLKLRYRRSVLGSIWTILAPMLQYLVMGLVFTVLLRNNIKDYAIFYFSGALFFSIISTVLNRSPLFFIQNEHFIRKMYVPKMIFIMNGVLYEAVNFLISMVSLFILGSLFGRINLSLSVFYSLIPLIMIPFFLLGLSCIISTCTVYFRDFIHLIPIAVQTIFFATPIVYDLTMIPEKYHILIKINPFYYFINTFRTPFIAQAAAPLYQYIIVILISLFTFWIGYLVVRWQDNKIVFKL